MGPPLSPSESGGMGFKGKPVSKGHGAGKSKDLGKGSLAKGPQSKGKMDLKKISLNEVLRLNEGLKSHIGELNGILASELWSVMTLTALLLSQHERLLSH